MDDLEKLSVDMRELGATGLKRFSGFIHEEFLRELVGWKGVAIYKEMSMNDPVVSAMLFVITMLCRKATWRVKPASQNSYDLMAASFLDSCRDDMSHTWNDMIVEILSFLTYGHDVHETVYKRRCGDVQDPTMRSKHADGRIGWRKITTRSQDTLWRWRFDDHGGIQGVEQIAPPYYRLTFLEIERLLLFRTTVEKNNPEGRSMLRGAYRPWYMKKQIENIEGIGIERDLAGLPMALVPPELLSSKATAQQKEVLAAIEKIVKNVRRDEQEGLVFPMAYNAEGKLMYEFKLLSSSGSRQFDTDKVINRYDQRIAMTTLADFILLGHEKSNGLALAAAKTSLFSNAISSYLTIIQEVFNRYAIPRLFALNPDIIISDYPTLEHGDVEPVDLNELGNYIQKLSQAGHPLFPNVDLEKHLLEVAGLPTGLRPEYMDPNSPDIQPKVNPNPKSVTDILPNPDDKGGLTQMDDIALSNKQQATNAFQTNNGMFPKGSI